MHSAVDSRVLACAVAWLGLVGWGAKPATAQSKPEGDRVFSSPLQRAVKKGFDPDGNLADALSDLGDYKVSSRQDARAIIDALKNFPNPHFEDEGYPSPLGSLTNLFENVDREAASAVPILARDGTPQLVRIFDALKAHPTEAQASELMSILRVLALYSTHEGAERIVEAAQQPIQPDSYSWIGVLNAFVEDHPEREFVFDSLGRSLPEGFIAIALLDAANSASIDADLAKHPFDSPAGRQRLKAWLTDRDPEHYSYAHSATAALPFLNKSIRDELLGLAREHDDVDVRIEAAWASAKVGQKIGLDMLIDHCRTPIHASTASRYLTELDREDLIPEAAKDPDFQAQAEFAQWLAHPNELARPPDEVEIVDKRTIMWPPAEEKTTLWLIKYRLGDPTGLGADDVDCGLVGSRGAWCFFTYKMDQRPPEDCYAIHCSWELGLEHAEVDDPSEYAGMLAQWTGGPLKDPVVTHVLELPPKLKYGRRLVAAAVAEKEGEAGWAVLDGSDSAWYARSEMPAEETAGAVLWVHVGRKLLGFSQTPDRKRYVSNVPKPPDPTHVVAVYEKLLAECVEGTSERKKELLANWNSSLRKHFTTYVDACEKIGRESKAQALIRTYQVVLSAVQSLPAGTEEEAYDVGSPLSNNFLDFADALVKSDRRAELAAAMKLLEPHWDHNSGYGQLGDAAFKAGDYATAERFFIKLRGSYDDWRRSPEMGQLATIWHTQGKDAEAQALLIDCLQGLAQGATEATGSDHKLFEGWYQSHRRNFLELFPDQAKALSDAGLPESTLK